MKKIAVLPAIILLIVLLLFDVRLDFQFSMPREVVELDAAVETRYTQCVELRDKEIHRVVFATIDNPDVQREYLATQKDKAKAECRSKFPAHEITVQQPFRFKLLELKFRYAK